MMAEREAIKELLAALQMGRGGEEAAEEEEMGGDYASTRDQYDVEPEDIEAELYDKDQDIEADALDTQEIADEGEGEAMEDEAMADEDEEMASEEDMSLRDLVAQFMNEREDPFEDKKGMTMMGSALLPPKKAMEIEIIKTAKIPKKRKKR